MFPTVFHPLKYYSLIRVAQAYETTFFGTLTPFKLNFNTFSMLNLALGDLFVDAKPREAILTSKEYTPTVFIVFSYFNYLHAKVGSSKESLNTKIQK